LQTGGLIIYVGIVTVQGTIAAQFSCEKSTLSGCDFELVGSGYRVSLIKKRFVSGDLSMFFVDSRRL